MPRNRLKAAKEPPVKYTVLRDNSEHDNHGWVFAESDVCAGTVVSNLYTADYSLEGYYDNKTFVIERKGSVAELVANLTQKEKWEDFKDELGRLEEFQHPFCICEFPFSLLKTYPVGSSIPKSKWPFIRVKPQFLLMRMEEIWLHFKTKFVFTDTPELGKEVASGLFKRVIAHARSE